MKMNTPKFYLNELETGLADLPALKNLSEEQYKDRNIGRSVERLVEIIVDASTNILKLITDKIDFSKSTETALVEFTKTRTLLEQEYMNPHFPEVRKFIDLAPSVYSEFLENVMPKLNTQ